MFSLFTQAILLYKTSKIVFFLPFVVTIYDIAVQEVTRGYGRLRGITRGDKGLQRVTGGYKGLQMVGGGYKG